MGMMAPEPPGGGAPSDQGQLSGIDLLREAAELMQQFEDEENDPQIEAEVSKFIAGIKKILSTIQGMEDSAVGMTDQTRYMRRQSAPSA